MIHSDSWVEIIKQDSHFCGCAGKVSVIKQVDGVMVYITAPYMGRFLEPDLEKIKHPTKQHQRLLRRDKLPRFEQILKVLGK